VLDLDGLMLDTESLSKGAWQQATTDVGYHLDDATYWSFVGRSDEDCERDMLARFGTAFPLTMFRDRRTDLWRQRVEEQGIQQKAGLRELLALIEGRNVPLAVATSSSADSARFKLRRSGLGARFTVIVTGDEVANGKPAPDIFLEAAGRLHVVASSCVAIEDSDAGVVAACRAGMRTLLVPDMKRPSVEAVRAAFRVLRSLHEAQAVLSALLES
jgi:HAD superfamily hydrolase (TIGR01509 family)